MPYATMKNRDRYPQFKKDVDGKPLCRGCGSLVPKGRQTWCSSKCYETRCPSVVRMAVERRDKGVCVMCNVDTIKAQKRIKGFHWGHFSIPEINSAHRRFSPGGWNSPFDSDRFKRAQSIRSKFGKRYAEAAKKRAEKYFQIGFPKTLARDWWEVDHIIPHSEGGEYILENLRTLCIPCHKSRTKKWHKERKKCPLTRGG